MSVAGKNSGGRTVRGYYPTAVIPDSISPCREKGTIVLRLARDRKTAALRLTFAIPADAVTGPVSVVGDFNDWTPGKHVLRKRNNGTYSAAVLVNPGTAVRFRYLGENGHWFDDPDADFVDEHGSLVTVRA